MENAHEDVTDLQCNRTNERKPAMRVENMPKSAKTTQIRENNPNPSPMQATDQECRPSNSLLVTHMLTIAHRSEDRTHKKRREERHVKPRL